MPKTNLEEKRQHFVEQIQTAEANVKRYITVIERLRGAIELIDVLLSEEVKDGPNQQESLPGSDDEETENVVKIEEIKEDEEEKQVNVLSGSAKTNYGGTL